MLSDDDAASVEWDGHVLLLHGSEQERQVGVAAWVRRGLCRQERVVFAVLGDPSQARSALSVLGEHGVDAASSSADGQIVRLPLADICSPTGPATVVQRALADGHLGLRMTLEATSTHGRLLVGGRDIERAMDQLCRTGPVSVMCQYDRRAVASTRLDEITVTHLEGIRERQMSIRRGQEGLNLAGEVDLDNHDLLRATLRAATSRASATLWLDLSALTFIDVGGARALAEGTREYRERGGYVLLSRPQAHVERILRMVRFHWLSGVELVGGT